MEGKIRNEIPKRFGLIMDGWSHNSEHYLAVFGCYEVDGKPRYPLLAMAPIVNEPTDDHSAATHVTFFVICCVVTMAELSTIVCSL